MNWLMLVFAMLVPATAMAAAPFARADIDDGKNIVPGQQLHVIVQVFAPSYFTSPPQFPLFDMPNALVTLSDERARNAVQTIDDTQYSIIARSYVVVPQVSGAFTIPAIQIELGYSADGTPTAAVAATQPLAFTVGKGDDNSAPIFAARGLQIKQSFDRDPEAMRTGDALVRTITITASDTQSMLIPPIHFEGAPGLDQYIRQPKLEDNIALGREMASRRTETVVYTATKPGRFALPTIDYPWFDVDAHSQAFAHLTGGDVTVTAASATAGIVPTQRDSRRKFSAGSRLVVVAVASSLLLVLAIWLARRLPRQAARMLGEVRLRISTSRRSRLRRLRAKLLSADLPQVYAALQQWSRFEGYRTLQDWSDRQPQELRDNVRRLEDALYGGREASFARRRVARLLARTQSRPAASSSKQLLPELNPG